MIFSLLTVVAITPSLTVKRANSALQCLPLLPSLTLLVAKALSKPQSFVPFRIENHLPSMFEAELEPRARTTKKLPTHDCVDVVVDVEQPSKGCAGAFQIRPISLRQARGHARGSCPGSRPLYASLSLLLLCQTRSEQSSTCAPKQNSLTKLYQPCLTPSAKLLLLVQLPAHCPSFSFADRLQAPRKM